MGWKGLGRALCRKKLPLYAVIVALCYMANTIFEAPSVPDRRAQGSGGGASNPNSKAQLRKNQPSLRNEDDDEISAVRRERPPVASGIDEGVAYNDNTQMFLGQPEQDFERDEEQDVDGEDFDTEGEDFDTEEEDFDTEGGDLDLETEEDEDMDEDKDEEEDYKEDKIEEQQEQDDSKDYDDTEEQQQQAQDKYTEKEQNDDDDDDERKQDGKDYGTELQSIDSTSHQEEGWNPIYIFYGEQSALLNDDEVDKKWFSQVHQDEIILNILGESGYFIDLAANDAKKLSNTLALERYGWNGLCVEPNPAYWYGLSHRKCTVVGALMGGEVEQVDVKFNGVMGGIVGKMDEKGAKKIPLNHRYTAPIADVLGKFNVPKTIEYLSLDVEGAEYLIMENFPFEEYQIKVMTVERPGEDLVALLEEKGYVYLKHLSWWGETLWVHESTGLTVEDPKIAAIETVTPSTGNKGPRSSALYPSLEDNLTEQPDRSSQTDGWHPVHVFYGERSALLPEKESKKKWFSQVHQDEIIVDLVGEDGYFIDLAANDATHLSNSFALERLGWNGLCVEPNPQYWYDLSHRKCTVVGALVGGEVEKVEVKFHGVMGGILGKMNEKGAKKVPVEHRYTAPLADVLERFNVPKTIDYLSLDVEGAEYLIMQNFPFDEYHIKVMTVERPGDELSALFESKGYVLLKKLVWWGETLWAHESTGYTPEHPKIAKIAGAKVDDTR